MHYKGQEGPKSVSDTRYIYIPIGCYDTNFRGAQAFDGAEWTKSGFFLPTWTGVKGKTTDKSKVSWINLTPTISTATFSKRNSGRELDKI